MAPGANTRVRREPVFDASPASALELHLDSCDRAAGHSEKALAPKPATARRGARPANSSRTSRSQRRAKLKKTGSPKNASGGGGAGWRPFRRAVYWLVVLGLWGIIIAAGAAAWVAAHLPPIQSLEVPKRPPTVHIVGLDGRPLVTRGDMGGAAVPVKELPRHLLQAIIAIEDRRFYAHYGFDPIGMARAALANVMHRGVAQGGSTLTQQLAKNLFLTQERTVYRKLQELVLALWIEHKFTKTQILDLYLNRIYFGAGAYGVEAAAQRYFNASARQLTLPQAALLAGLVKSPSRLAPTRNPDGAERRAQVVIAAMADAGFISAATAKAAIADPAHAVQQAGTGSVNYVADWIMDVLNDLVGRVDEDLVVETTVDPRLQAAAEKAVVEELEQSGTKFGVSQGALVAMAPDGAVRALVGGRNYAESQFNRAVAAKRQPGSAFKPFVYLTALERGLTPETVRDDRPINLKGWRPENYNREYFGAVPLSRALALSLNTVSVRLTLELGPQAVVRTAHRLGIASKLDANASIALGTSEVSPVELVSAFATFANAGIAVAPHVVERVRSANGKTLFQYKKPALGRVIDIRHVAMMNAMMHETLLTGTARRAELPGWTAAGKTGTSQDFRDAWFVGYTAHLVAGVWLGNDDSSPTRKTTGGGLPVEIWSRFMKAAHQGAPAADLPGLNGGAPNPASSPPAIVAQRQHSAPDPAPSLDRWLIDKLFGR